MIMFDSQFGSVVSTTLGTRLYQSLPSISQVGDNDPASASSFN